MNARKLFAAMLITVASTTSGLAQDWYMRITTDEGVDSFLVESIESISFHQANGFLDNFDDGNLDGWVYSDQSEFDWDVSDGQLRANGGQGSGNMWRENSIHPANNIDAGDATYEFDLTKESGAWYTAAGFRFCDSNSNWDIAQYGYHEYALFINAEGNGNTVTIAKFVDGESVGSDDLSWRDGTSADQDLSTADNRAYHYKIVKAGTSIRVYRDQTLIQSVVDTSDRPHAAGNIGFVKQNCVWRFDNVLVQ